MSSLQEGVDLKDLFSQDLQISMPVLQIHSIFLLIM